MADTVAELAIKLGLDTSVLDAGAKAAVATLDRVGGAITSMAAQFRAAATVMSVGGNATNTLAQIGIKTTDAIRQEIMAISELKAQLPAADAATAALTARQEALYATLRKAEEGVFAEAVAIRELVSAISAGGNANQLFSQMGVKTTQVLRAEVAALDAAIAAAQGDAAATAQLTQRKMALVAILNTERDNIQASAGAMMGAMTAQDALAAAGIRTSASIAAEITQLKGLMVAAQGDAMALNQLRMRMDMLTRSSAQMSGAAGSASFAVISLGQGFQDAGQFGMGMAQGIRAVTNNLQMSVQAFVMLTAASGGAAAGMKAFWAAMKGPAGFLLAFGAISAAIEFIANMSQKAAKNVEDIGDAIAKAAAEAIKLPGIGGTVEAENIAVLSRLASATKSLSAVKREQDDISRRAVTATQEEAERFAYLSTVEIPRLQRQYDTLLIKTGEIAKTGATIATLGSMGFRPVEKDTKAAASAVQKFSEEIAESAQTYDLFVMALEKRDPLSRLTSWASITSDRIGELFKEIREGTGLAQDVRALADEVERLMRLQSGNAGFDVSAVALLGGKQMTAKPPKELEMAKGLTQARDKMAQLNEEAQKVTFALADGINAELKQTQILLATMPISIIDNLSGAIGESVGQILTLQGGIEDMGRNLVQAFQNIVAEVAALIIKEKILLTIEKAKTAENARQAALKGMGGLGGLGTAGLVLGGFGLLTTILSGSRNYSANSGNTSLYGSSPSRRMAVEGVVLRSGDIEFSVGERRAINARIGR